MQVQVEGWVMAAHRSQAKCFWGSLERYEQGSQSPLPHRCTRPDTLVVAQTETTADTGISKYYIEMAE